jgi:pimeloyl-ACP methyl ester carboxylesterase
MRVFLTVTIFAALGIISLQAEPSPAPTAFSVAVTGQGKPAVLIPGFNSSGAVWDGTVAQRKGRFQCHVLTLAGFAGQPRVDGVNVASIKTMVTNPANVELLNSWSKASDPIASGSAVYDLFTLDLRQDIARITAPTLVLGTWRAYSSNGGDTAPRGMIDRSFHAQYALL